MSESSADNSQKKRQRRDERSSEPAPIRIGERDLAILQALHEYGLLSAQHIQTLFFPSMNRAYERLKALYDHGFIDRVFSGVYLDKYNKPVLYVLDKDGSQLLRTERELDIHWRKKRKNSTPIFLEHALAINTVRVA